MKPLKFVLTEIVAALCCLPAGLCGARHEVPRVSQSTSPPSQNEDGERLAYETWIRDYRVGPLKGALGFAQPDIRLLITVVEGDDVEPVAKTAAIFGPNYRISFHGCAVGADGTVSHFRRGSFGVQGGGLDQLTDDELKRLNGFIEELPDDNSKLPPTGHRIVVQAENGGDILARIYDLANAPDAVLEALRLSHSGIRPLTMDFSPQKRWPLRELSQTGIPENALHFRGPDIEETTILAMAPDGYMTVRHVLHDSALLTITGSDPSDVIRKLRVPQSANRFIGVLDAQFTPDGRYLMLLTSLPAIMIYDTRDWKVVEGLPDLPAAASLYYPSSDWNHGVAVYSAGRVVLWDAQSRRAIAEIDTDGGLSAVSFSPDGSMVATTSGHENKDHSSIFHLRIWNVLTGAMIMDLRPFERANGDEFGKPIWWSDGRFLLATVRDNPYSSNHDVGIWSVESGRFRGELSGCGYSADPLSILVKDAKLFERCRDGMILMWDVEDAINKISAYENSVTHAPRN